MAAITALATSTLAQPPTARQPAERLTNCKATDGDTLRCGNLRLRLVGIDAAELPGHCRKGRTCAPGDPARHHAALTALAAGQLTIVPVKRDRYGRIIARIRNGRGEDLSCAMLAAGATYRRDWDDGLIIARTCPSLTGAATPEPDRTRSLKRGKRS